MRSKNKRIRIEQLPAAHVTLILLAAGNSLLWCCLYLLPWNVVLLLYCILESVSFVVVLFSFLMLNGIIIALMKQVSLEFKCSSANVRIMRKILSDRSTRKELKGIQLCKARDAWESIDEAYYIRVNKGSSVILFASEINFSSASIHTEHTFIEPFRQQMYGETRTFHRYTLLRKNGQRIEVQMDKTETFLKWISEHHCRTVYQKN